jgi:hypothetical protein
MSVTAFSIGIMQIGPQQDPNTKQNKANDFIATNILQADPGYIPPGGIGIKREEVVFRPARITMSGTGTVSEADQNTHKITCRLFVSNDMILVDDPLVKGQKGHKVGLLITAAPKEAVKIGPFFGWISPANDDTKTMHVNIAAGDFLTGDIRISYEGEISVTYGKNTVKVPKVKVKGNFSGILSGWSDLEVFANPAKEDPRT